MDLVTQGLTNREIGTKLDISANTVAATIFAVKKKLRTRTGYRALVVLLSCLSARGATLQGLTEVTRRPMSLVSDLIQRGQQITNALLVGQLIQRESGSQTR